VSSESGETVDGRSLRANDAYRYSVFRRVVSYYSDDPSGMSETGEDAFDMRKPCTRDKKLEHVRDKGEEFLVDPEDVS
jgi:N-terminal acetyltransferase B complex catalytic subunit